MANNTSHGGAMTQRILIFFLSLWGVAAPVQACQGRPFGNPTATVGVPSLTMTYSGQLAVATIPVTVTLPPLMNGGCNLSLSVEAGHPIQLTLQHTQSAQHTLTYSIGSPFEFSGTSFHTYMYATQGQVYSFEIPVRIPANQPQKAAGTYQRTLSIRLINTINGAPFTDIPVLVSAHIAGTCTLPPPPTSVLDFSPGIINGAIPAPFQRTVSFANAGCNSPARLTLSAQPLMKAGANSPIHFSAHAVLGSNAVTLDTQSATTSFANGISAPASTILPIAVTILPTVTPLQAGTYSSSLRVSIEPAQ